jgi:hypothetical protein
MANQLRTIVKAVGELDIDMKPLALDTTEDSTDDEVSEEIKDFAVKIIDEPPVDPRTYRPTITKNVESGIQEWHISETDINYLANGCESSTTRILLLVSNTDRFHSPANRLCSRMCRRRQSSGD